MAQSPQYQTLQQKLQELAQIPLTDLSIVLDTLSNITKLTKKLQDVREDLGAKSKNEMDLLSGKAIIGPEECLNLPASWDDEDRDESIVSVDINEIPVDVWRTLGGYKFRDVVECTPTDHQTCFETYVIEAATKDGSIQFAKGWIMHDLDMWLKEAAELVTTSEDFSGDVFDGATDRYITYGTLWVHQYKRTPCSKIKKFKK